MEIQLSRFQNINSILTFACKSSEIKRKQFSKHSHFTNSKKPIKCSTNEQMLKPKPNKNPKQPKTEEKNSVGITPGLCVQIEKLVFVGKYREALELFEVLEVKPGEFDVGNSTYDALVSACIGLRSIRAVKRVYSYMMSNGFEADQYMMNRVLLMFVKCGMIKDAWELFEGMAERDFATWDTIIGGFLDVGDFLGAYRVFLVMWEEYSRCEDHTISRMLRVCAGLGVVSMGREFHCLALKMGLGENNFVCCALIDMYSKCGSIEDARFVFDEMSVKTVVGWNAMISGYSFNGYSEEALSLFYQMRDSGLRMDRFALSLVARISARLASVEHAKQVHAALVRNGLGSDLVANTALVDFYSKWGKIEDARNVFNVMPRKNILSWNALIAGYGKHGQGAEAIKMFENMLTEGMRPNYVTFLAVLSACSYSGLSKQGWEIFQSMTKNYGVNPRAMHFACMVELLGREGRLDDALSLINGAPFEPNANMWSALLTASRFYGNLELGRLAAEKIFAMKPEKISNYIVLLNIYINLGKRREAATVLQTLKQKGLKIIPPHSWIEIRMQQHVLYSSDKSHQQAQEIYGKVDELMLEISKYGYIHEKKYVLPDVDKQEEKKFYHSEKLAIAFGLINTPNWKALQVLQSHRICRDCHSALKLIAMVTGREIVVRDASRFHHFKDGRCSCGDYW